MSFGGDETAAESMPDPVPTEATTDSPVVPPAWQRKFHLGEMLPWKGEWFKVVGVGEAGIMLERRER